MDNPPHQLDSAKTPSQGPHSSPASLTTRLRSSRSSSLTSIQQASTSPLHLFRTKSTSSQRPFPLPESRTLLATPAGTTSLALSHRIFGPEDHPSSAGFSPLGSLGICRSRKVKCNQLPGQDKVFPLPLSLLLLSTPLTHLSYHSPVSGISLQTQLCTASPAHCCAFPSASTVSPRTILARTHPIDTFFAICCLPFADCGLAIMYSKLPARRNVRRLPQSVPAQSAALMQGTSPSYFSNPIRSFIALILAAMRPLVHLGRE